MLKGIPAMISPDLFHALMSMGHGDEIVLADGNFPAATCAKRLLHCDGVAVDELLEAIIPFFPLDHTVERPTAVMSVLPHEDKPPAHNRYEQLIRQATGDFEGLEQVERFAFYERAKQAYAIAITGDQAYKANLILKKGVVR